MTTDADELAKMAQRLAKLVRQRDATAQRLGEINKKIYTIRQEMKEAF